MRRFSVRFFMVLVVVAAVGLAALRNANVYWASAIAVVVWLAIAASVIGALALRGRERYGWAGFAVFSVEYLGVTVGTALSDPFKDPFGTELALLSPAFWARLGAAAAGRGCASGTVIPVSGTVVSCLVPSS